MNINKLKKKYAHVRNSKDNWNDFYRLSTYMKHEENGCYNAESTFHWNKNKYRGTQQ